MAFLESVLQYKYIIIFYAIVIAFLYIKRKRIDVQAKIIFLYRMKWGLKWMDKYAAKFREWVILLGYIGTGVGFIGMLVISFVLVQNLIKLILQPETVSGVQLVLPGIEVPGLGVLPFWYWIIGIFIIALVHEFAHGVVARAHNIKVKNTGIVFFGPILGAFVEPDEKKLMKDSDINQYSVLAAGSFSNILLAGLAVVLLMFVFTPMQSAMVEPAGFTFGSYVNENLPFAQAGIPENAVITKINDVEVMQFQTFSDELSFSRPGEEISVTADSEEYNVVLAKHPDNPSQAYLGIQSIRNEFDIKGKYSTGIWKPIYFIVDWTAGLLRWLFLLSFGIGLFNLLPLPIVDGGRMAQVFLHKLRGAEKGEKWYRHISAFFLIVLLLNLFYPFLAGLF